MLISSLQKTKTTTTLCLLAQILLSLQLWFPTTRTFPLVPAFDSLPLALPIAPQLFATLFVIALVFWLFLKNKQWVFYATILFAILLILQDINRLQVWFYQLMVMLLLIGSQKRIGQQAVIGNLQFMLIAIYIWSGFNKLGVYYIEDTFPWLLDTFAPLKPLGEIRFLAIASALFEMAIGIGLLFNQTKRLACYLVLLFHTFILLFLGPLGHNWNQVVWPWNLCQVLLVFFLFYDVKLVAAKQLIRIAPISIIILLLFGFMPAFNIVDKWPDQLSFKMYSGAYTEGVIYAPKKDGYCFPNHKKAYAVQSPNETAEFSLILDDWAIQELGVTPFVNQRFYKRLGSAYCNCLGNDPNAGIEILTADRWNRGNEGYERIPCPALKRKN